MMYYHLMWAIIKRITSKKTQWNNNSICGTHCSANPGPVLPSFLLIQHQLLSRAAMCPDENTGPLAAGGGHTRFLPMWCRWKSPEITSPKNSKEEPPWPRWVPQNRKSLVLNNAGEQLCDPGLPTCPIFCYLKRINVCLPQCRGFPLQPKTFLVIYCLWGWKLATHSGLNPVAETIRGSRITWGNGSPDLGDKTI